VLEHAERCRARRDELVGAEVALEAVEARLEAALGEHAALAARLSATRSAGAPALSSAVCERLSELAMEQAGFEVVLVPCEPGASGCEQAQFEIAANPGVPAAPLREIASGGELSRVMLACSAPRTVAGRRRSFSTRSTPGSVGIRRVRSVSSCARWPAGVRSSRSPTCRR